MNYTQFLESKRVVDSPTGIKVDGELNPMLFDFQRDIVRWALKRGTAAIFADCGMGKTPMQLTWAEHVCLNEGRVIVCAPLAVSRQTEREADKFGIGGVKYLREDDGRTPIVITNYEMLERFKPDHFAGVVLDESSILKSYTGKFRNQLVNQWGSVPFRLAATATPAPNDFMELGNHSEFLGSFTRVEMLSRFFVHDGGETQKWRLKGHAEDKFWEWMCGWAVMLRKPSDLGYPDGDFILPSLHINQLTVECQSKPEGLLFAMDAATLQERQGARRDSVAERVAAVADMINGNRNAWIAWCDRNDESEALAKAIPDAVEVKGSDSPEIKAERLHGFTEGKFRVLVSKPSIAGWGMNWQHCSHQAFTGLSDSYEQFYQAIRRSWRFGQKNEVNCYVVTSSREGAVVSNIKRKEAQSEEMAENMVAHMKDLNRAAIQGERSTAKKYSPQHKIKIPAFL